MAEQRHRLVTIRITTTANPPNATNPQVVDTEYECDCGFHTFDADAAVMHLTANQSTDQ